MRTKPAFMRLGKLLPLVAQSTLGKLRHLLRCHLACKQSIKDSATRYTENVRRNTSQLDVGVLKNLLNPIHFRRPLFYQPTTIASHIAQIANLTRRNETSAKQAILQESGKPSGILGVSLEAFHILQMTRIHQHNLELSVKEVKYRFPIVACALYDNHFAAIALKPLTHQQQWPGHSGQRPHLLPTLSCTVSPNQTYLDVALVDVHTSANRMQNSHVKPSNPVTKTGYSRPAWHPSKVKSPSRALQTGGNNS